jgi:hypothetical protein
MCDIWLFVRELGSAQMFRVRYNPFGQHELTDDWGTLRWPADLPNGLQDVYDELTAEKRRRLRGQGGDGQGYVEADAAEERAEKRAKDAKREKRDELIQTIYESNEKMTQQDLADSVGMSRSRIADIVAEA